MLSYGSMHFQLMMEYQVSSQHSPWFLMTGQELEWDKHAVLEFGSYVQCHEEHSNEMIP